VAEGDSRGVRAEYIWTQRPISRELVGPVLAIELMVGHVSVWIKVQVKPPAGKRSGLTDAKALCYKYVKLMLRVW